MSKLTFPHNLLNFAALPPRLAGAAAGLTVFALIGFFSPVFARTITYNNYDVEIDVAADSTFKVKETLDMVFNGQFQGVLADITLEDPDQVQRCRQQNLRCGGFEYLSLNAVYDAQGNVVPADSYEAGVITEEETEVRYYEIKRVLWPGSQNLTNEKVKWGFSYEIFGGLAYDEDYAYLYWNAIPEDLGGNVANATITIKQPGPINLDNLRVYTRTSTSYDTRLAGGGALEISLKNLTPATGAVTVEYRIPREYIDAPATLRYNMIFPWADPVLKFAGREFTGVGGTFRNLPAGSYPITFSFFGYNDFVYQFTAQPGETKTVDVYLEPTAFMWVIIFAMLCLNILGVIGIPAAATWVYFHWRSKGRDVKMPPVIIPLFHPPEGVQPYLLGTLKDEFVNFEDVTGQIIDLAYRGFLKIKENGSSYLLTRTDKSEGSEDASEFDRELLEALFRGNDEVDTKNLNTTFSLKYLKLGESIRAELLERGYFAKDPQAVRAAYVGYGIAWISMGAVVGFVSLIMIGIIGVVGPVLLGGTFIALGVGLLLVSKHMPAKTELGSKVYAQILGFRMYMYHAERYRVQGLDPEEFEKYLSYAIVFGIEKEWAKKFKDIYKLEPEWYEGQSHIGDALFYSRFGRDFANTMQSQAYIAPQSSGSGSGGWSSGGGGFGGGFSGGGGGGGGRGGF